MKDPFESARMQHEKQIMGAKPAPPAKPNITADPSASGSMRDVLNSSQKTSFDSSKLPDLLLKAGIKYKGLAMNNLGRAQLVSRLQNKFGPGYESNPVALDIMTAFDKSLANDPSAARTSMNATQASGDRTLKALLGG